MVERQYAPFDCLLVNFAIIRKIELLLLLIIVTGCVLFSLCRLSAALITSTRCEFGFNVFEIIAASSYKSYSKVSVSVPVVGILASASAA